MLIQDFDDMKKAFLPLLLALLLTAAPSLHAQQQEAPDVEKIINSTIDNLCKYYDLDVVQIFLVDSTLHTNYTAMLSELDLVKQSGAINEESYLVISDKWLDATDLAYERIFTKEQWNKYLKSSYGKEKRKRDKRMQEREHK